MAVAFIAALAAIAVSSTSGALAAVEPTVRCASALSVRCSEAAPARSHLWAPVDTAPIHPGVNLAVSGAVIYPGGGQFAGDLPQHAGLCTASFVFYDAHDLYLASAASCAQAATGSGAAYPCQGGSSVPLGTNVEVSGAAHPATLVYSSWLAMQDAHVWADQTTVPDADTQDFCANNDFALIRLDPRDAGLVNPTTPHWGGPTGFASPSQAGPLFSFGYPAGPSNRPHPVPARSYCATTTPSDWSTAIYTTPPEGPELGRGYLDSAGRAVGVLHGYNNWLFGGADIGNLSRLVPYMTAHSALHVELATGTRGFDPLPSR